MSASDRLIWLLRKRKHGDPWVNLGWDMLRQALLDMLEPTAETPDFIDAVLWYFCPAERDEASAVSLCEHFDLPYVEIGKALREAIAARLRTDPTLDDLEQSAIMARIGLAEEPV